MDSTSTMLGSQDSEGLEQDAQGSSRKGKSDLHDIWMAETWEHAEAAFDKYKAKYSKAVACLEKDKDNLLTFYDFSAEHWKDNRTTNPIESTFATVKHRTKRSKGCLSRENAFIMAFKLIKNAEKTWRRLDGNNQLPKIISGVRFSDGCEVMAPQSIAA